MKKISLMLAVAGFISSATFGQEAPKAKKPQPVTKIEMKEKAQENDKTLPSLKKTEPVNTAPAPAASTSKPQKARKSPIVPKKGVTRTPVTTVKEK